MNLETSIRTQLERKPKDQKRKRVRPAKENWEFSFRTWKVLYSVDEARCQVEVLDIQSAYSHGLPSKDEFAGRENSIEIHRKFIADFDR